MNFEMPDDAQHVFIAYRMPDGSIQTEVAGQPKRDAQGKPVTDASGEPVYDKPGWYDIYAFLSVMLARATAHINALEWKGYLETIEREAMRRGGIITPSGGGAVTPENQ